MRTSSARRFIRNADRGVGVHRRIVRLQRWPTSGYLSPSHCTGHGRVSGWAGLTAQSCRPSGYNSSETRSDRRSGSRHTLLPLGCILTARESRRILSGASQKVGPFVTPEPRAHAGARCAISAVNVGSQQIDLERNPRFGHVVASARRDQFVERLNDLSQVEHYFRHVELARLPQNTDNFIVVTGDNNIIPGDDQSLV